MHNLGATTAIRPDATGGVVPYLGPARPAAGVVRLVCPGLAESPLGLCAGHGSPDPRPTAEIAKPVSIPRCPAAKSGGRAPFGIIRDFCCSLLAVQREVPEFAAGQVHRPMVPANAAMMRGVVMSSMC